MNRKKTLVDRFARPRSLRLSGQWSPILIVDDDRSIRELLTMHLEERGYDVLAAGSGAEGTRLAAKAQPSAIVLDMRLPDGSGIDLLPSLREHAAESPVLMITAHHDMATTILAMKAGAFDYLHKPIDIEAFDQALAAHSSCGESRAPPMRCRSARAIRSRAWWELRVRCSGSSRISARSPAAARRC